MYLSVQALSKIPCPDSTNSNRVFQHARGARRPCTHTFRAPVVTGCIALVKRRLAAVAQGGFADGRRSLKCRREHYRANLRCRPARCSDPSAAVGSSRRQPPRTHLPYNPRLRRRGISERVFSRPLNSAYASSRTRPRRRRYSSRLSTCNRERDFAQNNYTRLTIFIKDITIYCPGGKVNTIGLLHSRIWCARARSYQCRVCAPTHTHGHTHAKRSRTDGRRSPRTIDVHARVGGPDAPAAASRTSASTREADARSFARTHAWPGLPHSRLPLCLRSSCGGSKVPDCWRWLAVVPLSLSLSLARRSAAPWAAAAPDSPLSLSRSEIRGPVGCSGSRFSSLSFSLSSSFGGDSASRGKVCTIALPSRYCPKVLFVEPIRALPPSLKVAAQCLHRASSCSQRCFCAFSSLRNIYHALPVTPPDQTRTIPWESSL